MTLGVTIWIHFFSYFTEKRTELTWNFSTLTSAFLLVYLDNLIVAAYRSRD